MMSRSFMIWFTANAGAYEPSTTVWRLYCSKGEATALSRMTSIIAALPSPPLRPMAQASANTQTCCRRSNVPYPNRGHRFGNALRGARRDSADLHEYLRGVQRLFQSTSMENDVERWGVVTDSGNDDIGGRDHTGNFGLVLK